ncbi:MAG: hypothetical protein MUO27_08625 [Sedimentisphaerales bacterium]|nr:hypothetical protein [Sedimentisphaerales bacterium]
MNSFSSDVDILRYEPSLFGDLHFASQVLTSGTGGEISGTTFSAASANFDAAKIAAGMVVYLKSANDAIDGTFEIVSVDSVTQLTISVLRADGQAEAIALHDADDVSYRICTYRPQSSEVFLQLTQHFGLRPGVADGMYSADDILDVSVLRQVSVYAILSMIFATLAGRADENEENFWKKNKHYRQLFEKALQRCRVCIDLGDDGVTDSVRSGSSVRLLRD